MAQWSGLGWSQPLALYPRQKTDRMYFQCGWFTIHGDSHLPIESIPGASGFCVQVPLPFEALSGARAFLEQAGISRRTLFPDLPNLATHLREQFGLFADQEPKRRPGTIQSPESSQFHFAGTKHRQN